MFIVCFPALIPDCKSHLPSLDLQDMISVVDIGDEVLPSQVSCQRWLENCWYTPTWEGYWWILNLIVVVDDWSILMDIESDCGCGWLIHFDGYWIWLWLWMIDPFWWILNLIVVVDDWSILMDIESDCGCGWLIHFNGYWIWLWLWMIDPFWWILNLTVVVDDWSILMDIESDCGCGWLIHFGGYWIWLWLWMIDPFWWILNLTVVVDDWSILMDIESDCGCGWLIHFGGYWIWLWLWMIDPFWWILNLIVVVDDWSILMYPTEGVSMSFFWGMVGMNVQPWRQHMLRKGYHTCCHLMSFAPLNFQGNYLDIFRHNQQWCICNFLQLHLALGWTKLMIIFVSLIGLYVYALGSLILYDSFTKVGPSVF